MKKLLLAATALVASAAFAFAADIPVRSIPPPVAHIEPPAFTWTGFYAGLNAGYGFSSDDKVPISGSSIITNAQLSGFVPWSLPPNRDGFIGGVQIGYNMQSGMLVYGLEADLQAGDLRGSSTYCSRAGCGNVQTRASSQVNWLGTLRGRLGVAFDRVLIYGTGGLAVGDVRNSIHIDEYAGVGRQFIARSSTTRAGWALGAGAEYAVTNNISVKGEYLYYNLGNRTVTAGQTNPVASTFATARFKNDGHIVRVGINYRL